jgi:CRP/FNR family transcriptional regulator
MNTFSVLENARKNGRLVTFKQDSLLFQDGDTCNGLLLVTKGNIKVLKYSNEGKEAILYRVNSNNLCILSVSCLIGSNCYNAVGIAEDDLEGIFLTHESFSNLINSDKDFRSYIFSNFAFRISDFIQKLDDIIFKSLKDRLKEYIEAESRKSADAIVHKSHQELAVEFGTSREVVSRILKNLETESFIELNRQSIRKL